MSKAKGPPKDGTADDELFVQAMADVHPLETNRHPPEVTYRPPTSISERESEVLQELDSLIAGEGDFELRDSDEHVEGKVPGLDPRTMKQLRRGEFTIQADLDLHGLDARTARSLVEQFLVDSHARGLRCVRIVHGRGRNSPGRVPVLKQNLPRWLARGPTRNLTLAYTTAAPHDGGAGASYVLLRRGARRARMSR